MTKILLNLVLSTCLAVTANAQHTPDSDNSYKTTGTESRLIQTANETFGGSLPSIIDSSVLAYSPNHGYEYDLKQWKYDSELRYSNSTGSFVNDSRSSQTFDSKNHIATNKREKFDGSQWTANKLEWYTYTANGQLETHKSTSYNVPQWDSMYSAYTYNANGVLVESLSLQWDGSRRQNSNKALRLVDANGLVSLSYSLYWNPSFSTWDTGGRTSYTYNTAKQVTVTLNESYASGVWTNSYKTTTTYDAKGNAIVTEGEVWSTSSSNWLKLSRNNMAYNANNDMITNTSLTYQNGTYVNSRLNEFAYNAYHQVTLERHKTWNAVTLQFEFILGDNEIRNYYELFTNDVKTVTSANNTLKVYPMPAGEFLHVQLNSNGNAASLYLFDNTGKMVKQVSTVAGSVINTIDMRDLPAGSYFLKAVSSGNTVTKQVTIVQ